MGITEVAKRALVGRKLRSSQLGETLLPKRIALPVFASDALSSVAYAPDEIFLTLSLGGLSAYAFNWKIGIAVTLVVMGGFGSMKWVAYLTVPAFLVLVGWSIGKELLGHDVGELVRSAPPGPPISLLTGTTLVAGGFIVGAVITADMTRFNRSGADVLYLEVGDRTPGESAVYPDDDLRYETGPDGQARYTRKDGTPLGEDR